MESDCRTDEGDLISWWMIMIKLIWKGTDWMGRIGSGIETVKTGSEELNYLCGLFGDSSWRFHLLETNWGRNVRQRYSSAFLHRLLFLLPQISVCFVDATFSVFIVGITFIEQLHAIMSLCNYLGIIFPANFAISENSDLDLIIPTLFECCSWNERNIGAVHFDRLNEFV